MGMEASPTNGENFFVGLEPNLLDQYDSPTYHFRLFLTRQDFFIKGEMGEKTDQITIAESGVTGIGIDEVIIKDTHGYSAEVGGSSTALSIKIMLKEPFNANLFDKLYAASLELGIDNYTKCVYYLELTFIGNDRVTSQPVIIDNKKWVYPIAITKVQSTITAAGTTYEIEAVKHFDLAHTDQNNVLLSNITVKKEEIFIGGELDAILLNFGSKITSKYKMNSKRNTYDNEWNISLTPEMKLFLDNDLTMSKSSTDSKLQEDFHFSDGTSITKSIDSILSASLKLQELSKAENRVTNIQEAGTDVSDIINKHLYKIHTEVQIIGYDVDFGDYIRRFNYYVYPYTISTVTASIDEGNMVQDISQKSVDLIKSEGRIKKHYNYLYTGKNTDIINFDLRFNMAWYVNLPRINRSTTAQQTGEQYNNEVDSDLSDIYDSQDINAYKQLSALIVGNAFNNDFTKTTRNNLLDGINNIDDVTIVDGVVSFLGSDVYGGPLTERKFKLEELGNRDQTLLRYKLKNLPAVEAQIKKEKQERNDFKNKSINNETTRVSDFKLYVEDYTFISEQNPVLNKKRSSPISFKVDNANEKTPAYGADTSQSGVDDGRAFFSALFAQANKTTNSDLLMGDFDVKGDPFWLEPPLPLDATKCRTISDSIEIDKMKPIGSCNTMLQENFFLFTTYVPNESAIFNDEVVSMGKRNVINGVYGVIKSTSKFSGGAFTQTLNATRHVLSDLNYVDLESLVTSDGDYTEEIYNKQTKKQIDIYNDKTIDPLVNQSPVLDGKFDPEEGRQYTPINESLNSGGSFLPGNGGGK